MKKRILNLQRYTKDWILEWSLNNKVVPLVKNLKRDKPDNTTEATSHPKKKMLRITDLRDKPTNTAREDNTTDLAKITDKEKTTMKEKIKNMIKDNSETIMRDNPKEMIIEKESSMINMIDHKRITGKERNSIITEMKEGLRGSSLLRKTNSKKGIIQINMLVRNLLLEDSSMNLIGNTQMKENTQMKDLEIRKNRIDTFLNRKKQKEIEKIRSLKSGSLKLITLWNKISKQPKRNLNGNKSHIISKISQEPLHNLQELEVKKTHLIQR